LAEFLEHTEAEISWQDQQKKMREKLAQYKKGKESSTQFDLNTTQLPP